MLREAGCVRVVIQRHSRNLLVALADTLRGSDGGPQIPVTPYFVRIGFNHLPRQSQLKPQLRVQRLCLAIRLEPTTAARQANKRKFRTSVRTTNAVGFDEWIPSGKITAESSIPGKGNTLDNAPTSNAMSHTRLGIFTLTIVCFGLTERIEHRLLP
jgi:hypothetical protein